MGSVTSEELVTYWINSAEDNYKTMKNMFHSEDYTWSLFIGHLIIEKLLKGLYAKNNLDDPY